jgi:S1-C subfamily serine protease
MERPDLAVVRLVNRVSASAPSPGGYGFLVTADGLIATTLHSLPGHRDIVVALSNGQTLPADFVQEDSKSDVALIQVHGHNLPFLKLHDDNYQPGMHVRIARDTSVVNAMFDHWEDFGQEIFITGGLAPSDAGAPVLADNGEVIGVLRTAASGPDTGWLAARIWHIQSMMARPE